MNERSQRPAWKSEEPVRGKKNPFRARNTHLPGPLQRVFKSIIDCPATSSTSTGCSRRRRGHRRIIRHVSFATSYRPPSLPRKKENGGGREPFTFLRRIVFRERRRGGRSYPRETSQKKTRDFEPEQTEMTKAGRKVSLPPRNSSSLSRDKNRDAGGRIAQSFSRVRKGRRGVVDR